MKIFDNIMKLFKNGIIFFQSSMLKPKKCTIRKPEKVFTLVIHMYHCPPPHSSTTFLHTPPTKKGPCRKEVRARPK